MDPRARGGGRGGGGHYSNPLGKRGFDERESGRRQLPYDTNSGGPYQLHFRILVGSKKAGSVIGRGGDFIQLTRQMTGAKVAVDKAVELRPQDVPPGGDRFALERLVHIEGSDEPGKELAGIQDAVLRTAERILGDESPEDGTIKLPHTCHLRMLLYKHQIGIVMGKRGAAINEVRNKSGAQIKLVSPPDGGGNGGWPPAPVVPCALPDDEIVTISGTPDQTLTALKMITDRLRAAASQDTPHHDYDRGPLVDKKRLRADGPPPAGFVGGPPPAALLPHHHGQVHMGPPPGSLPPQQQHPQHLQQQHPPPQQPQPPQHLPPPQQQPQQPPPQQPANAFAMALPPQARSVLDNNDSVRIEGLAGLATVDYRLLVPVRRSGVILGNKGTVINEIRGRTGARVNLFDEERSCGDRVLQIMSTEDVQDQHCAAFDAAMDCVSALLHDELATEPLCSVRIILPHGQVGAVMGKKGATIKELRSLSGASLQLTGHNEGVPACVKKGEEVLEIRGMRNAVMLTTHIVLVAVRGNMARGQLIYKYPLPHNAPPPTQRSHPPPAHVHLAGPPPGGAPPPDGGRPRSRWDSAEPRALNDSAGLQQQQQRQPLLGAPPPPGSLLPPGAHGGAPPPPGTIVYGLPPEAAGGVPPPPQQQQVHYMQQPGPPPAQQQQQPGLPPGAHYVQQGGGAPPPPGQQQPQQQGGVPGQPQVVVYASQPPPGSGYAPQQLPPQQQQQPVYLQQQGQQPAQHVVEYGSAAAYVQQQQQPGQPPAQQQQQPGTVVYAAAVGGGQPQHYQVDPHTHQQQQQVVASGPLSGQQQQQQQQQVTYVYAQAPPAADASAAAGAIAGASGSAPSGPPSGYGGLAGLMAAIAPHAAAAAAAPVAVAQPVAPPAPKARVLLTQEQVLKLRLNDPMQTAKLSALSGATLTLSDAILEHGAREVLLTGSDAECNTATNLMEALMRSAQ